MKSQKKLVKTAVKAVKAVKAPQVSKAPKVIKIVKAIKAGKAIKATKTIKAAPEVKPSLALKPVKSIKASPKAPPPKRKTPAQRKKIVIPPILLEDDAPPISSVSGPGQRYALGPLPMPSPLGIPDDAHELPEAYGTKSLLLTARDPHWLYAHWDFTRAQLREYNALSRDRHLVLRIHLNDFTAAPCNEVHVHPESRNWFVHVGRPGARFLAELGYYSRKKEWTPLARSGVTLTPPDTLSEDTSVRFATLPATLTREQVQELVQLAAQDNAPLQEILQQLDGTFPGQTSGSARRHHATPTAGESLTSPRWTAQQERALAEAISMDEVRRVWIGSLEITELVRRQLVKGISSPTAPAPSSSGAATSLSSPFGATTQRPSGFWFNVNAELIIYGATEPDAQVTIGGRVIKLRPDGSFSYRFALPDGDYELPAVAISADKTDGRAAALSFQRRTDYRGDVGVHPQDSRLQPPLAAHVA